MRLVGFIALLCGISASASAEKLVWVTTPSWTATQGELRRFERSEGGRWQSVGAPIAVVVGKGGLGWGAGLVDPGRALGEPVKREGDGRTPAGVFALTEVVGYDARARTSLPYRQSDAMLRCVDDGKSPVYNTLAEAPGDWTSAEVMRRDDELYRLVVVVAHNAERKPGAGSCIFLHVWRGPAAPTVGCVAMPYEKLSELVGWLDASTRLVVLPAGRSVPNFTFLPT